MHTQIHEVQRPRKSDPKKIMPGHIVIKLLNIKKKKKNFEGSKRKETHYIQGMSPTDSKEISICFRRNQAEQEGVR